MKKIDVGSDFSGVGAFDQALKRLNIPFRTVFACDMDLYARETFMANHGEPAYYPFNVYDREIPKQALDIYMTSPPCQAFSLAGKRKGEDDDRGVLFYNSHEFILNNNPRYFIFENVKGLLSDAKGRTFQIWLDMLGGKSVNGNSVIFPREDAAPYHIYYKVLNAKHYGVPQNRERVFIIGIRDDVDNNFNWPKKQHLTKRLKDVLEKEVDLKYYLSDKMLNGFLSKSGDFGNRFDPKDENNETADCITARYFKMAVTDNYLKVKSATKKGYETAKAGDSINLSNPNSETRRGRVGKKVAQTLDTACNQAVLIGAFRGRNPNNLSDRTKGAPMSQHLEINTNGTSNTVTSVQKDNVVVQLNPSKESAGALPYKQNRIYDTNAISPVLDTECGRPKYKVDYKIRKLTP